MSRIQEILNKAERDGTARRTRSLSEEYASRPSEAVHARALVDPAPLSRAPGDEGGRLRAPAPARPAPHTDTARPWPVRPDATPAPVGAKSGPAEMPQDDPAEGVRSTGTALDPLLVAALAPTSLAAEQYRSLRTTLKRLESSRQLRLIAVTSPAKGDGKSLTAANLALTMAQEFQQRVLLLDADLRRPSVHRLFGLPDAPGLADVLMNGAELDQALVSLPEYDLTVLPAGVPPAHPAELLGSAAMRRVLDTLRTRFDRILIDVPPVAPLADLHVLSPLVDGLLMIVRAGVTPRPAIERALAGLDSTKVLGLVLNEAGSTGPDAYNYEGYGYVAG